MRTAAKDGENRTPRVFVVTKRNDRPYLFQNYHDVIGHNENGTDNVKIWEAIRATSATSGYFNAIQIGHFTFVDGRMGYNNPTALAIEELERLTCFDQRQIKVIVSVGSGVRPYRDYQNDDVSQLWRMVFDQATDADQTHISQGELLTPSKGYKYYRLNPDRSIGDIGYDDNSAFSLLLAITEEYIFSPERRDTWKELKDILQRKRTVSVSASNNDMR